MIENIPSIQVAPWTNDFLRNVVDTVTDWNREAQFSQKDHIVYINNYLRHLETSTVVLEGNYIDQNYLDDYQGYYSSCFPHHPKCCVRLHFFSKQFKEDELISYISEFNSSENKYINESYLGYIVIRPIPETFIAKLCLKNYSHTESHEYYLIKKINKVNLFGLELTIDSAPFTEKDRVVSACATSAIWMLLNTSSHYDRNTYPSPSEITKIALNGNHSIKIGFPILGLQPEQVCYTLQHYGLEAKQEMFPEDDLEWSYDYIKSSATAYLKNDIPFLLMGSIYAYDNNDDEEPTFRYVDKHVICILGFHTEEKKLDSLIKRHEAIDKLYAHDDRYGPYLSLRFSKEKYTVTHEEDVPGSVSGFEIRFDKDSTGDVSGCELHEIFVPDGIIFGNHHKVRLKLRDIELLASNFLMAAICADEVKTKNSEIKNIITPAAKTLSYEIELTTNTKLKKKFIRSTDSNFNKYNLFHSFNGINEKSAFLSKSLPKHIWCCSIYSASELIGSILFDATEILHGKPLIGHIAYSENFQTLWWVLAKPEILNAIEKKMLDEDKKSRVDDIETKQSALFKVYLKYLTELGANKFILNYLYGETRLMYRNFRKQDSNSVTTGQEPRSDETDELNNVVNKPNVQIQRFDSEWSDKHLDKNESYIWLIDTDGDMYYGKEIKNDPDYGGGHATLNNGMPARLGGELNFINNSWEINLNSGAYSQHLGNVEMQTEKLKVVLEHNFNGWPNEHKPKIGTIQR